MIHYRVLIHDTGLEGCGKPFVQGRYDASNAGVSLSTDQPDLFRHMDGRPIVAGEVIACDSCGFQPGAKALPVSAEVKEGHWG